MKKAITILILMLMCLLAQAQERLITGTVKDNQGVGLPGVSIFVKGTITGVISDAEGNYKINAKQGEIFIFTSVGYKTQEIEAGTQAMIDVILKENTNSLENIVVIADEIQEKKYITGKPSVSKGKKSKKRTTPLCVPLPNNKK